MTTALLALGLAGCGAEPRSVAPNVVLVVMDTVRRDHLSTYGYARPTSPALDALAAQGTRFDRAYSTSSWTLPSHASMFTGLLPDVHGARQTHLSLRGEPPLLAELLRDAGYHTAAFSNNPWVGPSTGLDRGFTHFAPMWKAEPPAWWAPWAGHPTVDAVTEWLGEERDAPFFLFVNLMEAHGPYAPGWEHAAPVLGERAAYDRARDRYATAGPLGFTREFYLADPPLPDEVVDAARDLYDAEIREVDAVVGQILAAVDARVDPASTLVLVVTDHGEHFGEHGHVGHAFSVHEELIRVALVARGPGFAAGAVHDGLVQLTDVLPTALGMAGVTPPPGQVGRDLHAPPDPARALSADYDFPEQVLDTFPAKVRGAAALDPYRVSLRAGLLDGKKLIRDSTGRERIFDLTTDPGEAVDLAATADPALRAALGAVAGTPAPLPARVRRPDRSQGGGDASAREATLDEADRAALEQLGYLE